MLPHLIETAKEGKRTNYDELAAVLKMETRLFSKPLAFIRDDICVVHGLPPLTAVVENKGPDKLANSFAPPEFARLSKPEYDQLRKEALQKVYSYQKWDMALNGLETLYCVR